MVAKTYFISGHIDLTEDEFREHYEPHLKGLVQDTNNLFITGDAQGADEMAVRWLLSQGVSPKRITIVHKFDTPRFDVGVHTVGPFPSHSKKDAYMTHHSDFDIAHVRSPEITKLMLGEKYDPKRISGTQANINRRQKNTNIKQ